MFERRRFFQIVMCVLWLSAIAVAQSNQPIEINPTLSGARPGAQWAAPTVAPRDALQKQTPDVPRPKAVERRMVRLAQQLASAKPVPPSLPELPTAPHSVAVPVTASSAGKPLRVARDRSEPDPTAIMPIDSTERMVLGKPSTAPDATTSGERMLLAGDSSWILKTVAALGVVLAMVLLFRAILYRVLGRASVAGTSPLLEVLARVRVAPRQQILLIRTGKRVLLVGDTTSGLRTLSDITDPEEVAGLLAASVADRSNHVSRGFNQLLACFNGEYREDQRRLEEGQDSTEYQVDRARDQISNLMSRIRNLNQPKREQWT